MKVIGVIKDPTTGEERELTPEDGHNLGKTYVMALLRSNPGVSVSLVEEKVSVAS